jgi:hypothetical protein
VTSAEQFMRANLDHYAEVVSTIRDGGKSAIPVPRLSSLLGVRATTLNARFRRLRLSVQTVGRVNFVPLELALELAGLHKYALMGWPTVQQASQLTSVKGCTIKAKCEKGQVEGYMDLTKRLRINPAALTELSSPRPGFQTRAGHNGRTNSSSAPAAGAVTSRPNKTKLPPPCSQQNKRPPASAELRQIVQHPKSIGRTSSAYVLPPAPSFEVRFITAKDYGLPDSTPKASGHLTKVATESDRHSGPLCYDPDRPFSLSDCMIGKSIRYGEYDGTIVGILDEPFSPKIKVKFPEHRHPLMQEVLLIVEKRRS